MSRLAQLEPPRKLSVVYVEGEAVQLMDLETYDQVGLPRSDHLASRR